MQRARCPVTFVVALSAMTVCAAAFAAEPRTIRAAVIGGMVETEFWAAVAERFEKETAIRVEVLASGPKRQIEMAFREGKADLITMHASDTIINLVADGYGLDPHPWLKNDLVIVGPKADPAGIRGMTDAAAALAKIRDSGSRFVVHSSLGAQEVLRDVLDAAGSSLNPDATIMLFTEQARQVLKVAAEKNAYTLVGRIPFLSGKLPNAGLTLMVRGDVRLRRPYVVIVANRSRLPGARTDLASRLVEFLRREETQQWIAGYGRGQLDDQPIFFIAAAASFIPRMPAGSAFGPTIIRSFFSHGWGFTA
jgi:tungstate transport system substrate-binding protein